MSIRFTTNEVAAVPPFDPNAVADRRSFPTASDLESAFVARDAARDSLQSLLNGALCVTTGQQPVLFLGPLFTLYKALSAAAVAKKFAGKLRRPVVPVFWVAADDHDFAELNHVSIPGSGASVTNVELRPHTADGPLVPAYRELLGDEVTGALRQVFDQQPASEFRPQIEELFADSYRPDNDLATGFAEAMAELVGPFGVIVVRSSDKAIKHAAAPVIRNALELAGDIDTKLSERSTQLVSDGKQIPVRVGDGATVVMLEDSAGRDRLIINGDGKFITRRGGTAYSRKQLLELLDATPERFSANVLLRPVLEASLLPTLAYIGGSTELDYLLQAEPLYRLLEVEPQMFLPRWSASAIRTTTDKTLKKYGIEPRDLAPSRDETVETRIVREGAAENVALLLAKTRQTIEQQYAKLSQEASKIDPTLVKSVESTRNTALSGVNEIEKRFIRQLKRRNETLGTQIAKARGELYPLGKLQERVFSAIPYLCSYGKGFLDEAFIACSQWVDDALTLRS